MQALSAHFAKDGIDGLACHCCGKIGPFPEHLKQLLKHLEAMRGLVGKTIHITNAYRCPKHNAEVGGVPNSFHTQCLAADIWVSEMTLDKIAILAEEAGFKGIGKYFGEGFVHVDLGTPYARRWTE